MLRQKQSVKGQKNRKRGMIRTITTVGGKNEPEKGYCYFLTSFVTVHVQVQLKMTRVDPYEMSFGGVK